MQTEGTKNLASMPQVEENIGGRQDQKNNSLRTKTLAVGLLVVVGCFVVGVFRATTTTTTTAQARDVSSSPNGNSCHIYKKQIIRRKILFQFSPHNLTLHQFLHPFFFQTQPVTLAPA